MKHESGIPLGGLGTGSIEIRPDGYFYEWQIFNKGIWSPHQPGCYTTEPFPDMPPETLSFFISTRSGKDLPKTRRLGLRMDQHNVYSMAWLKSVDGIEFDGRFPVAKLKYLDSGLPVDVSAKIFSPFTPHDSRTSGTPGAHIVFSVRNRTGRKIRVSVLGRLVNPLSWLYDSRKPVNFISSRQGTTFLTMRAFNGDKKLPDSIGLSVTGGTHTWVKNDTGAGFSGALFWDPDFGVCCESILHFFHETGRLPGLQGDRFPAEFLKMTEKQVDALSLKKAEEIFEQLQKYPSVYLLVRRIESAIPGAFRRGKNVKPFLQHVKKFLSDSTDTKTSRKNWGDGALCSSLELGANETKEIRFTLGWYFPRHYSELGNRLGHMYENWFRDAEDVNRFLSKNYRQHCASTVLFADNLYNTSVVPEFADAWSAQLSTLTKCTWWVKDGDFGVWEGLGCCGFHTTDITYDGSFGLAALFPDLQKRQMEMGARFQREDGRVPHFFVPDFSKVDDSFDRVDMNQQFVLLVCRDYLLTGDISYVRRLWPNILKAMDNTARLDGDKDGLPDHETRRNTYDVWNFFGTPSYIASLWLSALLAAIRLAEDLGEKKRTVQWKAVLSKGIENFEKKLWNGKYYSLWVDGRERDECCMTDQIDGEWFTSLIGLGSCLPARRIIAVLKAIMKYNFSEEGGLINASYPPHTRFHIHTFKNLQATAPWSGIEYALASMMIDYGLLNEAEKVVKSVHDRYYGAGRFWNHNECGDHYYRAMSSWALLLALAGFKPDVPGQTYTIAPAVRQKKFHAPWVSSTGWGYLRQTGRRFELVCLSGCLEFRMLRLKRSGQRLSVYLDGRKVPVNVTQDNGFCILAFPVPLKIKAGGKIIILQAL